MHFETLVSLIYWPQQRQMWITTKKRLKSFIVCAAIMFPRWVTLILNKTQTIFVRYSKVVFLYRCQTYPFTILQLLLWQCLQQRKNLHYRVADSSCRQHLRGFQHTVVWRNVRKCHHLWYCLCNTTKTNEWGEAEMHSFFQCQHTPQWERPNHV